MTRAKNPPPGPSIAIVGLGHVGLATALAFCSHGRHVTGYDADPQRRSTVAGGTSPFYEPGLSSLLRRHTRAGGLKVVDSISDAVACSRLLFLAVPTPSGPMGEVDLTAVRSAAEEIGVALRNVGRWTSVVMKSTTVPGTVDGSLTRILAHRSLRQPDLDFGVGSNPEFLSEGTMVHDALHPYRIVIGVRDPRTRSLLRAAYAVFRSPIVEMTPAGAELVKYAANAMLATRVSFANEFSRVAEVAGVDIYPVLAAVGLDPRIGPGFLRAGPGFGGSCFTKDLRALLRWAAERSVELQIPSAVLAVNERQATHVVDVAEREAGSLRGKKVALLGLAFKAGCDDTAESRAYPIYSELRRRGAHPILYDPRAGPNFVNGLAASGSTAHVGLTRVARSAQEALAKSDLAIIQADWPEFRKIPARDWARLGLRLIVDARRSVGSDRLERHGLRYRAIGRPAQQRRPEVA